MIDNHVAGPIPDRKECPEERGRTNTKCLNCDGLALCEKEAHKDGECFVRCSLCEAQAHEDGDHWEYCRLCIDEAIIKGDCQ